MFKYKNLRQVFVLIIILLLTLFFIFIAENKKPVVATSYKKGLFSGEIPAIWSEYGNGFGHIIQPVSDSNIIEIYGYDSYAKYVIDSISPSIIMFSDVPSDRLDTFIITPKLKEVLISKAKKENNYSIKVFGKNTFEVIAFDEREEGGRFAEYFLQLPDASDGTKEVALFIEYQSTSLDFRKGVIKYLSTISI